MMHSTSHIRCWPAGMLLCPCMHAQQRPALLQVAIHPKVFVYHVSGPGMLLAGVQDDDSCSVLTGCSYISCMEY